MKQTCFEWGAPVTPEKASERDVDLAQATAELVIALMAQVMVAVVRAIEEGDDER